MRRIQKIKLEFDAGEIVVFLNSGKIRVYNLTPARKLRLMASPRYRAHTTSDFGLSASGYIR